MKVVVCIASHQRNRSLKIVLAALPKEWIAVVVISHCDDAEELRKRPNTHVYQNLNTPVGAKWQNAVEHARLLNPDLLVITGSDDVLDVDTEKLYARMKQYDMIGVQRFHAWDGEQYYQLTYKTHIALPIGAGRVYSRKLLNRINWQVFDQTRNRGLDRLGYLNATQHRLPISVAYEQPGIAVMAMKGPWKCMNSLEKYKLSETVDVVAVEHVDFKPNHTWTRQ